LVALADSHGPTTLTRIAKDTDLHPSKAHRYLTTLVRVGLASQDAASGSYDLGPTTRNLGVESLRRLDPVRLASARAVELCESSGHTVNVSVWSSYGPLMVSWITGTHVLPMVIRAGSTLPLLDSAVGHCFFTYLPDKATTEVLRTQQRHGETRKMTAKAMKELRAQVRENGYAHTSTPIILGLSALAAPVFAADGALALVIGMILPEKMMKGAEMAWNGRELRKAVDGISRELGHRG